jgi:hypothetical protein
LTENLRKEIENFGMEMLEMRMEIPILTIPRLPKSDKGAAAA